MLHSIFLVFFHSKVFDCVASSLFYVYNRRTFTLSHLDSITYLPVFFICICFSISIAMCLSLIDLPICSVYHVFSYKCHICRKRPLRLSQFSAQLPVQFQFNLYVLKSRNLLIHVAAKENRKKRKKTKKYSIFLILIIQIFIFNFGTSIVGQGFRKYIFYCIHLKPL